MPLSSGTVDFVLFHGLYSDSDTFGNSGAAVENLHVVDI